MLNKLVDKLHPEAKEILQAEVDKGKQLQEYNNKIVNYVAILLNENKTYYDSIIEFLEAGSTTEKAKRIFYQKTLAAIDGLKIFTEKKVGDQYTINYDYKLALQLGWIKTWKIEKKEGEDKDLEKVSVLTKKGQEVYNDYLATKEQFLDVKLNLFS